MIYLDDSGSSVVFLPLLLLLIAWEMNWTGPEVGLLLGGYAIGAWASWYGSKAHYKVEKLRAEVEQLRSEVEDLQARNGGHEVSGCQETDAMGRGEGPGSDNGEFR